MKKRRLLKNYLDVYLFRCLALYIYAYIVLILLNIYTILNIVILLFLSYNCNAIRSK